ncbi:alpha/beta hydrolase fold domain-containing protein [Streptomyces sp. NEAU-174]|uniref:alpha/beta hydrolase fold domain-containing protein n=1 Tax=Streptomyces sp. NEAU-174 TaxID=3458254 RepID=UPI004044D420
MPSRTDFAGGYGLTTQAVDRCIDTYLVDPAQRHDPRFAPVLSDALAVLRPTVLVSAGCDSLHDDAHVLLQHLRASGVPVDEHVTLRPARLHVALTPTTPSR